MAASSSPGDPCIYSHVIVTIMESHSFYVGESMSASSLVSSNSPWGFLLLHVAFLLR